MTQTKIRRPRRTYTDEFKNQLEIKNYKLRIEYLF